MEAAAPAFKTPLIGRRLYGAMRSAGYDEVEVRVLVGADTRGYLLHVLTNMTTYALEFERYDSDRAESLLEDGRRAVEEGTWLGLLPQFLVTGHVSRD